MTVSGGTSPETTGTRDGAAAPTDRGRTVGLLVLALFSQRLRMPAADGKPYRKGSAG